MDGDTRQLHSAHPFHFGEGGGRRWVGDTQQLHSAQPFHFGEVASLGGGGVIIFFLSFIFFYHIYLALAQ